MNPNDYAHFVALVKARLGIDLGPDKAYLLKSRLQSIANTEGHADVEALLAAIRARPEARFVESAIEALTTNETLFFRDNTPFDRLKILLDTYAATNSKVPLRIWCAACSTGQEPYSIAMLAHEESARHLGMKVEITASDVSPLCLAKARAGIYSQFEAQRGLTIQRLMRHFDQAAGGWQIKPDLKAMVTWKQLNLMEDFRGVGQFDIVFCRNVLIYFDRAKKREILSRIADQMRDGGSLFLGAAETTLGLSDAFEAGGGAHGCHTKKVAAARATAPLIGAAR
jgi:chemotaxis protein methyltransferase CheR